MGTIGCALERQRVVALLPDRFALSVAQWRPAHPSVESVCRDRSGLYAEGRRQGAPPAVPVVDRCHLVQHLRDALARFLLRSRHGLKPLSAWVPPAPVAPALRPSCTTARPQHHERGGRRYDRMPRWHAQGVRMAASARRVQGRRPTVSRSLALPQPPERQRPCPRRPSLLPLCIPSLWRRWNAGWRTARPLWRETGPRFTCRQVAPAPWYAAEPPEGRPAPVTALQAARLFLATAEAQRPAARELLARRLPLDPVMPPTDELVQTFCRMRRQREGQDFAVWGAAVPRTGVKELRAWGTGLLKDAAAVRAGLSLVWSNGPTAGLVPRLQWLQRQAEGRAGGDFVRHRIRATPTREAASPWARRARTSWAGAGARTHRSSREPLSWWYAPASPGCSDHLQSCGRYQRHALCSSCHRAWRRPRSLYARVNFCRPYVGRMPELDFIHFPSMEKPCDIST